MIGWWPLYGLRKKLTERKEYFSSVPLRFNPAKIFQKSLFVYVIDVGSSNALNFEISALQAPQYNTHRFGIYFTDSPRHADVLLILGRPTQLMLEPLQETVSQLPHPFYIITIDDCPEHPGLEAYPQWLEHIAHINGITTPSEILGLLLDISKLKRKKS